MGSQAEAIWRWIETNLMNSTSGWGNKLDYGTTVDEDHMDEFVKGKFGGYRKYISFRIEDQGYKMNVLPMQNKNTRAKKAYGSVKGGGENKVNVMCYKEGRSQKAEFNLHIQVRRQATADKYRKMAANKAAEESGGWQTA